MPVKYGFTAQKIIDDGRVSQKDIDMLKVWLKDQKLPQLTDEQIVIFLLSCDLDQSATQTTVKAYYSARDGGPELFNDRDINRDDLQFQLNTVEYSVFPQRTDDGCAILFHRLYDTVYSNYSMEEAMKILFMTLDAAIYDYPPTGLVILFDMKGVGLMHLLRVRIGLVRKFFHYLQEGLPVQLREVHILNSVYFLDKVKAIIKPFIKKEVMEMLHFYPTNMDMEHFYETVLPKKCLPEDFGGSLPSTRILHQQNTEKLASMLEFFKSEEFQRKESNYK